jgi:hypothetical protein
MPLVSMALTAEKSPFHLLTWIGQFSTCETPVNVNDALLLLLRLTWRPVVGLRIFARLVSCRKHRTALKCVSPPASHLW